MTNTPKRLASNSWPECRPSGFTLHLEGGRALWVPWTVSLPLAYATPRERAWLDVTGNWGTIKWRLIGHELRVAYLAELAVAHEGAPNQTSPRFLSLDLFTEAM